MQKQILVVGSSNVDLVLKIPRFHHPGETITGEKLVTAFGGKGANQAVAAKRLGGKVHFVTKVGNDHYGETYRNYLVENGFGRGDILQDKKHPTGVAIIEVKLPAASCGASVTEQSGTAPERDTRLRQGFGAVASRFLPTASYGASARRRVNPKGENRIIVSPGANGCLTLKDVARLEQPWKEVGVFVTQLEIPLPTVHKSLRMAKDRGVITLLNPSPALRLPPGLLSLVDFLVPNEWEAQTLTRMELKGAQALSKVATKLLAMGTRNVVITLGAKGLFYKNKDTELRMPAFKVKAVDSTSAGDAFMGGLACGLSEDMPIDAALRFANGAGALATTKLGAQPSLPSRPEVDSMAGS
jgi:ribokinase